MRKLKLGLLGFGNAGKAFASILETKKHEIMEKMNCDVVVTGITTSTKGSLFNPQGIDLKQALSELEYEGGFNPAGPNYRTMTSMELIATEEYDVIVEMTPLDIFSGQPATDHLRKVMEKGKHAITANKGPIAWYYNELKELAEEKKVQFYFETTVMDGTPIFNLKDETLKYCTVTEINGILNTTTNYVLDQMALGKDYKAIILEGKRIGFVEADPSLDMEGWDAAAKVAALLNVLMNAGITPMDVDRTGIDQITLADIKTAAAQNKVIKLLCNGILQKGEVQASVKPTLIDKGDLMATINGTSSIIQISTDLMGKLTLIEHDPDLIQTGYGIFSDVIRVIRNL